jgi:hypothetical protein
VVARDSLLNKVSSGPNAPSSPITLAIKGGTGAAGAVLGGNKSRPVVAGVAQFDDLTIDKPAAGYVLTASLTGAASQDSAAFNITTPGTPASPGPPERLVVLAGVTTAVTNQQVGVANNGLRIAITDTGGNIVTTATDTLTPILGPSLFGFPTNSVAFSSFGVGATTNGVSTPILNMGGARVQCNVGYLVSTLGGHPNQVAIGPFDLVPGPATGAVIFSPPPQLTKAGAAIFPAVQVVFRDAAGNTVTTLNDNVQLKIKSGTGTGGAVLTGGGLVPTQSGVALFPALSIDLVGTNYVLTAFPSSFPAVDSPMFDIN